MIKSKPTALNSFTPRTRLFFLHIPKAAGTTFKEILYKHYRWKDIAWIDGSYHDESVAKLLALPAYRRNRYRCVMGHFRYGLHRHFDGPSQYITFLRDPVRRVASLYYHIRRSSSHHALHNTICKSNVSLRDFVMNDFTEQTANSQTRWLSGDENVTHESLEKAKRHLQVDFAFFGITEQFDRSLMLAAQELNLNHDWFYTRKNIGKYTESEVEDKDKRLIGDKNSLDVELYHFALDQFEQRCKRENEYFERSLIEFQQLQNSYDLKCEKFRNLKRIENMVRWKIRHMRNPLLVR